MRIPRRGGDDNKQPRAAPVGSFAAAEAADRLLEDAARRVDEGAGAGWYAPGGGADLAALTLCRLRRAQSGALGGAKHGDDAVRAALRQASPEAVVWLASRAISYMDESDFPFTVERWFPQEPR